MISSCMRSIDNNLHLIKMVLIMARLIFSKDDEGDLGDLL